MMANLNTWSHWILYKFVKMLLEQLLAELNPCQGAACLSQVHGLMRRHQYAQELYSRQLVQPYMLSSQLCPNHPTYGLC